MRSAVSTLKHRAQSYCNTKCCVALHRNTLCVYVCMYVCAYAVTLVVTSSDNK